MEPSDGPEPEDAIGQNPLDVEELSDGCRHALQRICIYTTRPGRKVFVEHGNCDGWISTDEAVDVVE